MKNGYCIKYISLHMYDKYKIKYIDNNKCFIIITNKFYEAKMILFKHDLIRCYETKSGNINTFHGVDANNNFSLGISKEKFNFLWNKYVL